MRRWAFIYTLGADGERRRVDRLGSDACELIAIGVASVHDAPDATRWLRAEGVELVELCGAFGPSAQAAVADALGGAVPFGAVTYPCDQSSGLHRLFG